MANEVYGRTWKIDTPGSGILHSGPFRAKSVRWVSASAQSDDECLITDINDKVIWHSRASGANHKDESVLDGWWNSGFKVPTLTSGTLYITVQ
jgi:hypothetical protein